jgi:hypothetical protein
VRSARTTRRGGLSFGTQTSFARVLVRVGCGIVRLPLLAGFDSWGRIHGDAVYSPPLPPQNTLRPASASCRVFSPPVRVLRSKSRGNFDCLLNRLLRPEPLSVALDAAICILSRASRVASSVEGEARTFERTNHNMAHFG